MLATLTTSVALCMLFWSWARCSGVLAAQGYGIDAVAIAVTGLEAAAKKNAHEALDKAGYSVPSGAALTRAAAGVFTVATQ